MPALDQYGTFTTQAAPVQDDKDTHATAAAPTTAGGNALTVVFALAGFMILIYILHCCERMVKTI